MSQPQTPTKRMSQSAAVVAHALASAPRLPELPQPVSPANATNSNSSSHAVDPNRLPRNIRASFRLDPVLPEGSSPKGRPPEAGGGPREAVELLNPTFSPGLPPVPAHGLSSPAFVARGGDLSSSSPQLSHVRFNQESDETSSTGSVALGTPFIGLSGRGAGGSGGPAPSNLLALPNSRPSGMEIAMAGSRGSVALGGVPVAGANNRKSLRMEERGVMSREEGQGAGPSGVPRTQLQALQKEISDSDDYELRKQWRLPWRKTLLEFAPWAQYCAIMTSYLGIGVGFIAMTSKTSDTFSAIWAWAVSVFVFLVEIAGRANKRIRTESHNVDGEIILTPPKLRKWIAFPCNLFQKFYVRAVVYSGLSIGLFFSYATIVQAFCLVFSGIIFFISGFNDEDHEYVTGYW